MTRISITDPISFISDYATTFSVVNREAPIMIPNCCMPKFGELFSISIYEKL